MFINPMEPSTPSSAIFEQHRDHLFGIAYRMLGRVAPAEDIVQEAYLRWRDADTDAVRSPRAYLSTVVTRLCLDELKSARARREEYVGPWLPEPLVEETGEGPERATELADSLSMAFLVLLETLTPVQRAVFLLREVFDYAYSEIADLVGRKAATCRKIAQRAREHIDEENVRFEPSKDVHQRLVEQFFAAVEDGDMDQLEAMLGEDAILYSDGGGQVTAAQRPIYGANRIARFMLGIAGKAPDGLTTTFAEVNGRPGLVAYVDGTPQSAWAFHVEAGRIQTVYAIVNPEKLKRVPARDEV